MGLIGLGLLLYGLYVGLGVWPFFFCLVGIVLLVAEDHNRRR
jgi:hypothetical protein